MTATHPTGTQDEAAVLAVLDGVHDAWSAGDPDAFVADYLDDASAHLPGSYLATRQEIREAMASSFGGPLKGTSSTNRVLSLRFLGDDTALVVTENGILVPGETAAPPARTSYATWVLTRRDGRWQVAAYGNSPSTLPTQA